MTKHSVLIVDHEETVLALVKRVLFDDGYEVHTTESSREAIDLAQRIQPELLVINPTMPTLSGVEAALQISLAARCKVLFLSDLAKDSDFREMLRGLRQQGCECSAIGVPFERNELLASVRREIGPVVVITDPEELPSATVATPRTKAATSKTPIPDWLPLVEMMGPQLYELNAFRVTALQVDASLVDVSRRAEKLEMMAKLRVGAIASGPFSATAPSVEDIRAALQCLKTPHQRLLHEFFWFWPTDGHSDNDPALSAVKAGDLAKAEQLWHSFAVKQQELTSVSARLDSGCPDIERGSLMKMKKELERATAVSVHNLAVLFHIRALTPGMKPATLSAADDASRISAWTTSYKYWSRLQNQHGFWAVLVERIRDLNDPRLGVELAEAIWTSLPLALLSINAQFAVAAAEARNFEEAGLHQRLMKESAFGASYVRDALCRSLKPLQQELARLCQTTERNSIQMPEQAADLVRTLFEDKKKYLQAFNYLLGAGDPLRDSVHDLVAQAARTSLVAYTNQSENWEVAQPFFEECLALAESRSLRSRLEDDLETLAGNLASQRAAKRTQATAAPPRTTTTAQQPTSSSSTSQVRPTTSRSPWLIIAAVVVVGILMVIAVSTNDEKSSNIPIANSPRTTSSSSAESPSTTSDNYATPRSGDTTDIESLKSTIEENRSRLRQMESNLSDLDGRAAILKTQIESDQAELSQMQRDHDLGYQVNEDHYETTRQRHNAAVARYDSLINEYNSSLPEYKLLLSSTNDQIDRYNALVRKR